jgi:hypothetical protein
LNRAGRRCQPERGNCCSRASNHSPKGIKASRSFLESFLKSLRARKNLYSYRAYVGFAALRHSIFPFAIPTLLSERLQTAL